MKGESASGVGWAVVIGELSQKSDQLFEKSKTVLK